MNGELTFALLVAAAAWRVAVFLVHESGPFDIAWRIRRHAGVEDEPTGPLNPLAAMLICVWCTSVWTTLLMAGVWLLEPWVVVVVAAMGFVLVYDKAIH